VETIPVPEPALREAILNAIVHKEYASGVPVQISVYSDQLMIWNPGHLPPNWTVERLLGKHASQPFNPDVANAFFRAGMIEAWGRGIERVLDACRQADLPTPELREEHPGFWIVFRFAPRPITPEVTPEVTPELRVLRVVQGEVSRESLQRTLGLKDAEHFRQHYLAPALAAGLIEMTLPDKPNSRLQKYRLTAKGRALLGRSEAH
jgi:ATP-dependent DNA helicase RecG